MIMNRRELLRKYFNEILYYKGEIEKGFVCWKEMLDDKIQNFFLAYRTYFHILNESKIRILKILNHLIETYTNDYDVSRETVAKLDEIIRNTEGFEHLDSYIQNMKNRFSFKDYSVLLSKCLIGNFRKEVEKL